MYPGGKARRNAGGHSLSRSPPFRAKLVRAKAPGERVRARGREESKLNDLESQQASRDSATKSVLVVDDEPNIVLSLEFLMRQAGFEVRVARDGEQALAAMREKTPDLVLLDVMIPRGDGYGICKAVRSNPAWRSVRIIMLTAKGRESERDKGIALGADDYIIKPFSTREVVGRVRELLGVASG